MYDYLEPFVTADAVLAFLNTKYKTIAEHEIINSLKETNSPA